MKVFNVGDEFLVHVFKAHLTARVCYLLKLDAVSDPIPHDDSHDDPQGWLRAMAEKLLPDTIMPPASESTDHLFKRHRAFLHMAYLYVDLRNAIRHENGPQIVRHWKMWLPRFIGTGMKNYATESVRMLANILADMPKHVAYIVTNNRTVKHKWENGPRQPS